MPEILNTAGNYVFNNYVRHITFPTICSGYQNIQIFQNKKPNQTIGPNNPNMKVMNIM